MFFVIVLYCISCCGFLPSRVSFPATQTECCACGMSRREPCCWNAVAVTKSASYLFVFWFPVWSFVFCAAPFCSDVRSVHFHIRLIVVPVTCSFACSEMRTVLMGGRRCLLLRGDSLPSVNVSADGHYLLTGDSCGAFPPLLSLLLERATPVTSTHFTHTHGKRGNRSDVVVVAHRSCCWFFQLLSYIILFFFCPSYFNVIKRCGSDMGHHLAQRGGVRGVDAS